MKLTDVKNQVQIGDSIITKSGYIGNSRITVPVKLLIKNIEEKGNSIRLYFDLKNIIIFDNNTKQKYNSAVAQHQNNTNMLKSVIGQQLGYPLAQGYITSTYVDRVEKDPVNVKTSVEVLQDIILGHQTHIKHLMGDIEAEKSKIKEVENKLEFMKKFSLDTFDTKKYKAYKLVEEISKLANGKNAISVIEEVSKII